MFKSILKINSIFNEIKTTINKINELDVSIEALENEIESESNLLKIEMSNYIDNARNKISSLNILNNERGKFSNSDNFVNFSNDNHLDNNNGLNIDHDLSHLISEVTDIQTHSDFVVDYKKEENIFSIIFSEEKVLNSILYSFFNSDGNPVIPVSIFFNGDYKNVLYREWMNKVSKTDLTPNFSNKFYFEPTFAKTLHFKFDEPIEITRTLLNLSKNTYSNVGQAVFSFECSNKIGFTINKSDYTKDIGVSYSYSLDNSEFYKIKTTDSSEIDIHHGTVLFDTPTNDNSNLYIKIERDNSTISNFGNIKTISTTNIINGNERKNTDISFDLSNDNISEDLNLIVSNSIYETYKDKVPDYFQKTTDGLISINSKYILMEDNINDLRLLSLRNQNTINSISNSSFIFRTSNNVIYMPSILTSSEISFLYNTYEEEEVLKPEDYTPLVFDFSINYADGEV